LCGCLSRSSRHRGSQHEVILEDEGHVSLVLRFDAILDELLAESA